MLGNTRSNCSRQTSTTCISVVLNNFIKKRLTTKSREANCDYVVYFVYSFWRPAQLCGQLFQKYFRLVLVFKMNFREFLQTGCFCQSIKALKGLVSVSHVFKLVSCKGVDTVTLLFAIIMLSVLY